MTLPAPLPGAPPLEVRDLSVRYGAKEAVRALSFTVRPGEVYGLLGSNGAGKSSTIRSIVGLLQPAGGAVRVFGTDTKSEPIWAKARIGYVPETTVLFDALTPREFLEFVASVRGLDRARASARAAAHVRAFQFEPEFDRPIATLSNGTRQKVLVVAALLHDPPLLVLDEPLNNLDPRSARILKELLRAFVARDGRGVLFSTHAMEVAEQLCERVGILDHGVLRGEGTMAELRRSAGRGDANLEQLFLHLTQEESGVREAVDALRGA